MHKFTQIAKDKGWKMKDLGKRWALSSRRMSSIAANSRQRELDSLNGVEDRNNKVDPSLIKAAPEMFEALEAVLKNYQKTGGNEFELSAIELVIVALKKAKGKK